MQYLYLLVHFLLGMVGYGVYDKKNNTYFKWYAAMKKTNKKDKSNDADAIEDIANPARTKPATIVSTQEYGVANQRSIEDTYGFVETKKFELKLDLLATLIIPIIFFIILFIADYFINL